MQNLIPGDNPKYSGYLIGYSNTADLLVDTNTDPEPMVEKLAKAEAQRRARRCTTPSTWRAPAAS